MSDQKTQETEGMGDIVRPDPDPAPPEATSLAEQLVALKVEQAEFDAKLVGKAIGDLEKLLDEVETAKKSYTKADYDQLVASQNRLEAEKKTLEKALEAALGDEIDAVKAVQKAALDDIGAAEKNATDKAMVVDEMQKIVKVKTAEMAAAQAALDRWRKPKDSIDKRQKAAGELIEEIKKLRNGPNRGEAYWKLALGDRDQQSAQGFLHLLLKDPPELVKPDKLEGKIEDAWDVFKHARADAAAAQSALDTALADHKAAKADYDAKTKSIIKTIIDALAAREAPPAA